jgi:hypothetical protein
MAWVGGFLTGRMQLLEKVIKDDGVLLVLQVSECCWDGVSILWCPDYGGGGWVDVAKDAESNRLMRQWSGELEQQVANCLAL